MHEREERAVRIAVVGTSGCGKSSLGQKLETTWSLDHVDLDELHWGPNWTPRPDDEFVEELRGRLNGDRWVVTGNYAAYRAVVLERATHIVWLDYSAWTIGRQLLGRTIRRVATAEVLFGGCVETFRHSFASRDSVLLWAATTHRSNRRAYLDLFSGDEYPHVRRVQLRSRREADNWLERMRR